MAEAPSSRLAHKRRGTKPYDVSNSFVQRVTSSVSQLLPQPTWLSQWFAQSECRAETSNSPATGQTKETSSEDPEPAAPPEISEDEGDSSDEDEQPVTKHRPKIPLNKAFPVGSFRVHHSDDATTEAPCETVQRSHNHDAGLSSNTGPYNFTRQTKLVSSTPAVGNLTASQSTSRQLDTTYGSPILPIRTVRGERVTGDISSRGTQMPPSTPGITEEKVNGGDDQSVTSESTSIESTQVVKPSTYKQRSLILSSKKRRIVGGEDDTEEDRVKDAHHLQGPRYLSLDRKRARLVQNLNCSSASQHETTLDSRNPSFNIDVYGSRKDNESRGSLLSSSFYAGETTYGGASAYERRKSLLQPSLSPACFPRFGAVEVRPKVDSPRVIDTGVSRTARRILDTLQQLSTPVREARGIPVPSRQRQSPELSRSGPPTRPLNVPSVPELLRLRQKERIQSTMSSARAVASSHKESAQEEYSLRLGEFQGSSKYVSKMKTKQNSNVAEDPPTPLNLPNVPLPITTLPKFDLGFSSVSLSATVPSTLSTFSSAGINFISSTVQTVSPIQAVTVSKSSAKHMPASTKTGQEVPVFTFRQPLDPEDDEGERAVLDSVVTVLGNSSSTTSNSNVSRELHLVAKSNSGQQCVVESENGPVSNSSHIGFNSGSETQKMTAVQVSDVSKQTGDTWQCKSCNVKNTNVSKCVCGQVRGTSSSESSGFGAQFKLSDGMWECSACMVRNKNSDASCVACTTPKPGNRALSHDPQTCTKSSFGDKFKPPASSWECTVCLVRNPENLTRCQACTSEKPQGKQGKGLAVVGSKPVSSFVDQLKKPEGSWYCTVCMACNKPGTKKCSSCDYVNPNSIQSGLQFKFDIPADAGKFKFGVDKAGNNDTKNGVSSLGGFSFGGSTKTTVVTTYSFGIPTTVTSSGKSVLNNATSEISSVKTSTSLFSAPSKSENESLSLKPASASKKHSLSAQDEVDEGSEPRDSGDRSLNKTDAKKISFCFEPMKGFGTSPQTVPKQDSDVSSSSGVVSPKTLTNSPFSSPRSNISSSKSSMATNSNYNFLSRNLTVQSTPVHGKTSADSLTSNSVVKPDQVSTDPANFSKSSDVAAASGIPSSNESSDSESLRKKFNSSKQTDYSPRSSLVASEVNTSPKVAAVLSSTPVSSTIGITKITAFGTPTTAAATTPSSGSSVLSNVNSISNTVTSATAVPGSTNSGSTLSTPSSARFPSVQSTNVFGVPSTIAQTFNSVTTTSALPVFPTTVTPLFTSTTSTIPSVFGVTTVAPIFGVASTTTTTTPVFGTNTTSTVSSVFTAEATPVFGGNSATALQAFGSPSATPPLFRATTTTSSVFGTVTTTPAPTFGATSVTTTASPVFGVAANTAAPSIFGATTTTTASQVFGVVSTTATPAFGVTTTSSPVFGVATTITPSTFGAGTTTTNTTPSVFGSNAGVSAAVFGATSTTPSFVAAASAPGFGGTGSNFGVGTAAAPAFGTTLPSGFGAANTTAPAFGSTTTVSQSFENSGGSQVFGGLATDTKSSLPHGTEKSAVPFAFGTTSANQGAPSQPFQFSGSQTNSVTKPDFSFGSANVSGAQRPGFGFGSSGQQSSPFGFGSNVAAPTAAATLFPSGTNTSTPAAGPLFGSAQTPANFGGTNTSSGFSSGGFNFGQSNTNVFGFSGVQSSAPSASAPSATQPFQFGQSGPVQFDPNAKPIFNFTHGETPSFTASAAGTSAAPPHRRIKKAMRRAHR